jgi:hypothetical protein
VAILDEPAAARNQNAEAAAEGIVRVEYGKAAKMDVVDVPVRCELPTTPGIFHFDLAYLLVFLGHQQNVLAVRI